MFARVTTVAFEGIEARAVDVQVQIGPGLPAFAIVGLPDKAVAESRERVRAALNAIGLALPPKRHHRQTRSRRPARAAITTCRSCGRQLNGSAIYVFNFENKATDYESGEILNLEGNITKNLGRWGVGVTAHAMIQTTPDTGAGARLGAFESRVNGIGPLVTNTLGDPKDPLTFIAKYYKEFDAENTFEGESFDIAVTAKF